MENMKPEIENTQTSDNQKESKPKNKFIIKYIIFVIVLILITAIGIYFTIKYIDKNQTPIDTAIKEDDEKTEEQKKFAEDSKYAIKSYSETYDTNSLEIKKYNDTNGKIIKESQETRMQSGLIINDFKYNISFVQIDGLKNKEVQDEINAKLKNVPYTLEKEQHVWSSITANFSNVLSVVITSDKEDEVETLNFDLTTGEEIEFEKLFVSSAPIKSMIAAGIYEDFAWNKLYEDYDEFYDMKNVDTSEIEDQVLLSVNKYDKIKDEIVFSFSPTSIEIYNSEIKTQIDMVEYANEIAIYKRYVTEESIFEDDNIGSKGLNVLTADLVDNYYLEQISYGKISDNIFVEEVFLKFDDSLQEVDMTTIMNYVNKLSTERKKILKQETPSNKGIIFQGEYHVSKDENKGYYCITSIYYKAQCSSSYFKDKAFKDYIEMKSLPRVEVGMNAFSPYMQEDYPEMQISEEEYKQYYLSITGEFLGNTIEEVENKMWE